MNDLTPTLGQPSTDQILAGHGLTGDQIMGLVRRAITDELGRRRSHLPVEEFEDLHSKLVEMAIGLAHNHDPQRSTLSLATRIYRTARLRTVSRIRDRIRDAARRTEDTLDDLVDREDAADTLLDQLDPDDFIVTRTQRQAWSSAAQAQGLTLAAWLIQSLDHAAHGKAA